VASAETKVSLRFSGLSIYEARRSELGTRPREHSNEDVPLLLAYLEFYLRPVLAPENGTALGVFDCTLKMLFFLTFVRELKGL
jgi:hypothetical protein